MLVFYLLNNLNVEAEFSSSIVILIGVWLLGSVLNRGT